MWHSDIYADKTPIHIKWILKIKLKIVPCLYCFADPFPLRWSFACLLLFRDRILHSPGWPQTYGVAKGDFELLILFPLLQSVEVLGLQMFTTYITSVFIFETGVMCPRLASNLLVAMDDLTFLILLPAPPIR